MNNFRKDFINQYGEEYLSKLEKYIFNFLKGDLGLGPVRKNRGLSKEKFEFLKSEIQRMTGFSEDYTYKLICYVEEKNGYRSKFKSKYQNDLKDILVKLAIMLLVFYFTPLTYCSIFTEYNFWDVFEGIDTPITLIFPTLLIILITYSGRKFGIFSFKNSFFLSLSYYFRFSHIF